MAIIPPTRQVVNPCKGFPKKLLDSLGITKARKRWGRLGTKSEAVPLLGKSWASADAAGSAGAAAGSMAPGS